MDKPKIIHITIGTPVGGISTLLRDIIQNDTTHQHIILSLDSTNEVPIPNATIITKPIKVSNPIASIYNLITAFVWLPIMVAKIKPNSVLAWTIPSCFVSLLVRLVTKKLFWTLHGHIPVAGVDSKFSVLCLKMCSMLSGIIPKKIIYGGMNTAKSYTTAGFNHGKSYPLTYGIDKSVFHQNTKLRKQFRSKNNIAPDKIVIGWMARPHPVKDPELFIKAMKTVCEKHNDIVPIMAGPDIGNGERKLDKFLHKHNMINTIITLPNQPKPEQFYNGIDILSVTSISEGGPLTILESASCGTLYTMTKTGDWESVKLQQFVSPVGDLYALVNVLERAIKHIKTKNPKRQSQPKSLQEMTAEYMGVISGNHNTQNQIYKGYTQHDAT